MPTKPKNQKPISEEQAREALAAAQQERISRSSHKIKAACDETKTALMPFVYVGELKVPLTEIIKLNWTIEAVAVD